MARQISILLVLALAAAIAIGCGSSGDATSSAAESADQGPLTKAEFIKKADAICTKADDTQYNEARKYAVEHKKALDRLEPIPREEKIILAIELPSILKEVEEIRALGLPEGNEKKAKEFLAQVEEGVKKAKKHPYTVEYENPTENPFRQAVYTAREYGFDACTAVI